MRFFVSVAFLIVSLAPGKAFGEFPYPANPLPCDPTPATECIAATEFHRYLSLPITDPPTVPNDFRGNWKLSSAKTGNPAIDENPQELFGVTGASVDLAWQVTTGRPDVVIAVLDSGIRWGEVQRDLVNKFYLNRGELPVPEGSTNTVDPWDRNGDGIFNIRDYLATGGFGQDSRVSDQNGNGMIDPEDLIFLFSDGVDDDGNGYVDDISGWDFFEDDNNALDEVRYGHGTGESRDAGAEANNGIDEVGTCPNCLLLEIRVGDSFVTEVNDFAQGVVFAVDSGAQVVLEALGTLNHSEFGQQAIDYAYERGTVVIASAADEESRHPNFPAAYRNTVVVNSVTKFFDQGGFTQSPPSYLYLNGCTNYGGNIAVSVPSTACSSEATGLSAGMAGLVISAALNEIDRGNLTPYPTADGFAPYSLSPEEIRQILIHTADDINFDARDDVDPPRPQNYETTVPLPGIPQQHRRFPSVAGFDQYFGYGRINADAAVRRVRDGLIPPEASILEPGWFAYLQPQQGQLSIEGRVAARRTDGFRYWVEVAPGVQPSDSEFVVVHESEMLHEERSGTLAGIDLGAVAALMPHGITGGAILDDGSGRGDPDRFAFTVRLRVVDDRGLQGEARRTLFLHDDPQLVPGCPRHLGADGAAPPRMADLDGDGIDELIVATSNGNIHAFRLDGSELPGWPVSTDPIEVHEESAAFRTGAIPIPRTAMLGSPAVGDLDRDGRLEVVATDLRGRLYVWSADGQLRPGFPVTTLPQYSHSWRSERDLTTDAGRNPDKTNRKDRHNRLGRAFADGPTLANLDGSSDGSLEILAGATDRHVYAWFHDGTPVPGWPVMLRDPSRVASVDPVTNEITVTPESNAVMGSKIIRAPSVADLDGDGRLEVLSVVNEGYRGLPNAIFDGILANLLVQAGLVNPGNTRVYAIRADGTRSGDTPIDRGWNPDAFVPGWPVATALFQTELLPSVATGSNGSPVVADFDGDGLPEIVTFSAVGPVYVFRGDGSSFLGVNRARPVVLRQMPFGLASNSADQPTIGSLGGAAVAPLGGAGTPYNIMAPTSGLGRLLDAALPAEQFPADDHMSAWSLDGNFLPGFPREVNDLQFFVAPIVADLDGDGMPEVIQGSGVRDLHAYDINGDAPEGWPKFTAGWTVAPPAVGDLDGDGSVELAHVTREGYLFIWRTDAPTCGFHPWPQARHDAWGTSNVATDARPPAAISLPTAAEFDAGASLRLSLTRLPGDDLYCGELPDADVRFAFDPILDEADFARALPTDAAFFEGTVGASGYLVIRDHRTSGRRAYLAARSRDAAGNVSVVTELGGFDFPVLPTATPTDVPAPTATATPPAPPTHTSTAPPTNTTPATPTNTLLPEATISPTAPTVPTSTPSTIPTVVPPTATTAPSPTAIVPVDDSNGCAVHPQPQRGFPSFLGLGFLLLLGTRLAGARKS